RLRSAWSSNKEPWRVLVPLLIVTLMAPPARGLVRVERVAGHADRLNGFHRGDVLDHIRRVETPCAGAVDTGVINIGVPAVDAKRKSAGGIDRERVRAL